MPICRPDRPRIPNHHKPRYRGFFLFNSFFRRPVDCNIDHHISPLHPRPVSMPPLQVHGHNSTHHGWNDLPPAQCVAASALIACAHVRLEQDAQCKNKKTLALTSPPHQAACCASADAARSLHRKRPRARASAYIRKEASRRDERIEGAR